MKVGVEVLGEDEVEGEIEINKKVKTGENDEGDTGGEAGETQGD